ncbi:MAG: hypothetical protein GWP02_08330 [Desulfobulbaceae bacterium]|nr:hypothetical protein [Desulfobulbaceae bacterium]
MSCARNGVGVEAVDISCMGHDRLCASLARYDEFVDGIFVADSLCEQRYRQHERHDQPEVQVML